MSKLLSKCCGAVELLGCFDVYAPINFSVCSSCHKLSEFEQLADDEEIDHEKVSN